MKFCANRKFPRNEIFNKWNLKRISVIFVILTKLIERIKTGLNKQIKEKLTFALFLQFFETFFFLKKKKKYILFNKVTYVNTRKWLIYIYVCTCGYEQSLLSLHETWELNCFCKTPAFLMFATSLCNEAFTRHTRILLKQLSLRNWL